MSAKRPDRKHRPRPEPAPEKKEACGVRSAGPSPGATRRWLTRPSLPSLTTELPHSAVPARAPLTEWPDAASRAAPGFAGARVGTVESGRLACSACDSVGWLPRGRTADPESADRSPTPSPQRACRSCAHCMRGRRNPPSRRGAKPHGAPYGRGRSTAAREPRAPMPEAARGHPPMSYSMSLSVSSSPERGMRVEGKRMISVSR